MSEIITRPPTASDDAAGAASSGLPAVPQASGRLEPPRPVLEGGAAFEGLLVTHGAVRIDGVVRGEILGADLLEIGETGRVEASIEADEVVVAGAFEGEIRARRRVELRPTARVQGSIDTPRLALAEGSVLEGPCRAGDAAGAPSPDDEKPDETGVSSA